MSDYYKNDPAMDDLYGMNDDQDTENSFDDKKKSNKKFFYKKIEQFLFENETYRKPLEDIIDVMLNSCRYINGESLERHHWGGYPKKIESLLHKLPNNIIDLNPKDLEDIIVNELKSNQYDKSITELLWGDIQLGKRVAALFIIWFSVYVLKRPVIYIFRNLTIDRIQLQNDILGTRAEDFNTKFIKNLFEKYNTELQSKFNDGNNTCYYKKFKIPEMRVLNDKDCNQLMSKFSNKDSMNPNDVVCCLMNYTQLEKLNKTITKYICHYGELLPVTLIVDESDLACPTASNDNSNKNDLSDTTKIEQELAKLYKKVKYGLQITGTAHSLLYNTNTRLSDHTNLPLELEQVHKMDRTDNYHGIFNNKIKIETDMTDVFWEKDPTNPEKIVKNYDTKTDYNRNINPIINIIKNRQNVKYNSLALSESKFTKDHSELTNLILNNHPELFIIEYNGKKLQLYFSSKYKNELIRLAKKDTTEYKNNHRLDELGGIYDDPKYDDDNDGKLPNNYCYYDIHTTKFNIKMIYKLLAILFKESIVDIKYKTVITITGKYSERGYSFTSDDYNKFSFHLTDQYFVSHASFNCTDILQRTRLQGKYNDPELKNGNMELTLWTTPKIKDVIQNFFVPFIKRIEKDIMNCYGFEDIKNTIEGIIDNGQHKYGKYMKYIDVSKKRKNLKMKKCYDPKSDGYRLLYIDGMKENEIRNWCSKSELPDYKCINEIHEMNKDEFIEQYGVYEAGIPLCVSKTIINGNTDRDYVNTIIREKFPQLKQYKLDRKVVFKIGEPNRYEGIQKACEDYMKYTRYTGVSKAGTYNIFIYEQFDNIHITITTANKILPNNSNKPVLDTSNKKLYYQHDDVIYYSKIREEFINDFKNKKIDKYYWISPDKWLYLHDENALPIISLKIVEPQDINKQSSDTIVTNTDDINPDVLLFTQECIKKPEQHNLRIGIEYIYTKYKEWCSINNKSSSIIRKLFKNELSKLGYNEASGKGKDQDNKYGKRGYNLTVMM